MSAREIARQVFVDAWGYDAADEQPSLFDAITAALEGGPHHTYRGEPLDCEEYEALIVRPLRTSIEGMAETLEEWEGLAALMRTREQPWIARWQQETGQPNSLPDYGDMLAWLVAKLDAAREDCAKVARDLNVNYCDGANRAQNEIVAAIRAPR